MEKPLSKKIKNVVDDSADQTDIWDNERWKKTRKLLISGFTKLNKEAVDKLKEEFDKTPDTCLTYKSLRDEKIDKIFGRFE